MTEKPKGSRRSRAAGGTPAVEAPAVEAPTPRPRAARQGVLLDGVRGVVASLDSREDRRALAAWRKGLAPFCKVTPEADTPFHVSRTTWTLPQGIMSRASGSAQAVARPPALIAASPVDRLAIYLCRKGRVSADCDGRRVEFHAGDLVLIDAARPMAGRAGPFACASVAVPRMSAPARFRTGAGHGAVMSGRSSAGRLVRRHMDTLFAMIETLTQVEAEAAFDAFVTLTLAVWPMPAGEDPDARMIDRARAIIRAELGMVELNPQRLVQRLRISRAGLYTLFAPEGGVSAYIQKIRLEEALRALVAGPRRPGLIRDVSQRFGFKSMAHFSRAFSARFGRTASDVIGLSHPGAGAGAFVDLVDAHGAPDIAAIQARLAAMPTRA